MMVRMKMLNLYNTEDVPDHVIEELKTLIMKIMTEIAPVVESVHPNLVLSAMNHINAIMIKIYISEEPDEIKKAARNLAGGFLGNVKFYTGVDPLELEEGHQNDDRS
jgi:hypothetical protein